MPQNPGQFNSNDDILLALDTTGLSNSTDTRINPSTEEKQDDIIAGQYPGGTGSNGTVTLTDANTAYAVPGGTAPTGSYVLAVYNGSDSDCYIRKTTGTTLGVLLPAGGTMTISRGANKQLFAYCASAGKILQGFYTEIN